MCLCLSQPSCFAQTSAVVAGRLAQLQKRADKGFTHEQIELAEAYMKGQGVQRNPSLAAYWYEKAARNGDPAAEHQIGYLYSAGLGVPRDQIRAAHWYQLAASSGLPTARVNLGVMYLYGRGVPKDIARARELFQQAADHGEGVAATYLGVLEFTGKGGPPNLQAARKCFQQGVRLHDPVAAYELATFYQKYDTQTHDNREVADLLRRSSDRGYVRAKYALGIMLLNAPQLTRSPAEAIKLLEDASNAGDWLAAMALGDISSSGYHAAKDFARAFYFYKVAMLEGGSPAQEAVSPKLEAVAPSVSEKQQSEATEQANFWIEQHRAPLMFVLQAGGAIPTFKDLSTPAMESSER
ncbi:MAG TPA: tetratricopeptide repeat protein [Terracidiphilus sp.]